jgi:hypothetical protein
MNDDTSPAPAPSTALVPAASSPTPAERVHHPFSPSKLHCLDECAAFLSHGETSDAAEQGTFLHGLMDAMIQHTVKGAYKTTLEQVSAWLLKKHELAEDEVDFLRFCCKRVDLFLAKKPSQVLTEIQVAVTHPDGRPLNSGYLDVLYIFGETGIVQDFKFGWIPVAPAHENLQGQNYVLGCFLKFSKLNRIGLELVQPKLNWITSAVFERSKMHDIYVRLSKIIEQAEYAAAHPEEASRFMKPGNYCRFCQHAGKCTALSNYRAAAVSKFLGIPLPPSFKGLELTRPEDLCLARYWVDIIEQGVSEIKSSAFMVAENNGGELRCTLPGGKEIVYTMQERSADRSLGSAPEVAEALKEICSPEEVLGAADLAIGKLEAIVKTSMVELAKARGEKLTKKAAWEQVSSTLEALGLLTRPDNKIRFLKLQKESVKQITLPPQSEN